MSIQQALSVPLPTRRIVYFSTNTLPFFDNRGKALLPRIMARAAIQLAPTPGMLMRLLALVPRPLAVLVTDEKLRDMSLIMVWDSLVNYARAGGVLVVTGHRSVPPYHGGMFDFLARADLRWRLGQLREENVSLNYEARERLHPDFENLPMEFKPRAVFLQNVPREDAWYLRQEEVGNGPPVCSAGTPSAIVETPVAFGGIGIGRIGYVGDVGVE